MPSVFLPRGQPQPRQRRLRVVALERFLGAERRLIDRARGLLDMRKTPLHVSA
jgi:hypothetical protein